MSKHRVRGKGHMPEYWEWTCDYCGKRANTNSQATRPPGWVPKGRTIGSAHDFCSAEHEEQYKAQRTEQAATAEGGEPQSEAATSPSASTPEPVAADKEE